MNSENWIRKAACNEASTYIFIVITVFELFDSNIGASWLILCFVDNAISPAHKKWKIMIRITCAISSNRIQIKWNESSQKMLRNCLNSINLRHGRWLKTYPSPIFLSNSYFSILAGANLRFRLDICWFNEFKSNWCFLTNMIELVENYIIYNYFLINLKVLLKFKWANNIICHK